MKVKVLLIDDDPAVLNTISEFLRSEGFTVLQASTLHAGYTLLEKEAPEICVVDYELPDGNALQFLAHARKFNPGTKSIVLTGYGSIELAVRAIKQGAEHFLTKPVQLEVLDSAVRACVENQQNQRKQLARNMRRPRYDKNPFHGTSAAIQRLALEVRKIVSTERPILIQGETGTGKGVLAQWIHQHGPRAQEPFVDVNCAGLSRELLESELFGHERGAFTGATASKQGLAEVAHRGILFLDELGEMDVMVQPKLLKIVEEHRFRRVGDVRERVADLQVIGATNRNLLQLVREKKFREDLYFRINTFHLVIPPLRERAEDIPVIANLLLQDLANDLARGKQTLSRSAEAALKAYSWPGNIRELRNVLERVALTCDRPVIELEDLVLPQRPRSAPDLSSGEAVLSLAEVEKRHINKVLAAESGRVAQAAVKLGIPRSTLYQKIKTYGITIDRNDN